MAYQRASDTKVKGDSLDAFVSNLSNTYKNQVAIRNAADETNFNRSVVEDNLSLEDQLAYRKEQLKDVSDDPAERSRIKNEITALKKLIVEKKFTDEFTQKVQDFSSGLASIDSVIDYLTQQKAATNDETILNTINSQLSQWQGKRFSLTQDLLKNQTDYALNSKANSIITSQIDRVNSAKTKALLAGDNTTASMLDLQLQGLNKALTENEVSGAIKNMAISTATGYMTATQLLDQYNSQISQAANDGPITVGDTTYNSPKEFWTFKRDSYLSDSSDNGFFGRVENENKQKIAVADSKNSLTGDLLSGFANNIQSLVSRPELQGYAAKIDQAKQTVLQTGANAITDTITNRYTLDNDLGKAVGELNTLKASGVNVDAAFTKIMATAATLKKGAVDNILQAAQTALQNNPNLTPEQALNQAIASGAGTVMSPNDLNTTTETDIAKNAAKTATTASATNDPRLTVPNAPAATPVNNQPASNAPAAPAAGGKTITVKPGETLSQIAQRELGDASRYAEIAAANGITDPNKIQSGATLKIPGAQPAQPAPQPAQPAQPAPQPQPQAPKPAAPAAPAPTQPSQPAQPAPAPTPAPAKQPYQGSSIVDYLTYNGQDASFGSRAKVAQEKGITNYQGTAEQNTALLKILRGF